MLYQRIQYFLQAAEEGSLKRAAEQHYVSAQALTKQVGLLEEELGGKLFERSAKGVSLTKLGEYAQSKFGKIDKEFQKALEDVKVFAHDSKERLRIGIFSALPQDTVVTPIISFLLANYPQYQIALELLDSDEGRKLLTEGKIDILLSNIHDEDDWGKYRCLKVADYESKVIVSLRHPWAVKEQVTAEDMKQGTFLKMKMAHSSYKVSEKESFYANIPCREIQEVSNFDTLFALLQQGEAFAVFPMAFFYMNVAKIKAFDYPGRKLMFHSAILYDPESNRKGLTEVVAGLVEEFDLKEV